MLSLAAIKKRDGDAMVFAIRTLRDCLVHNFYRILVGIHPLGRCFPKFFSVFLFGSTEHFDSVKHVAHPRVWCFGFLRHIEFVINKCRNQWQRKQSNQFNPIDKNRWRSFYFVPSSSLQVLFNHFFSLARS